MMVINRTLQPRRTGYSLIEMMTVIALLGFVMTTAIGIYHQALQGDLHTIQSFQQFSNWARLGEQLREDAARTAVIEVQPANNTELLLVLSAEQGEIITVRYQIESRGIRRNVLESPQQATATDYFQLASPDEELTGSWEWEEADERMKLTVTKSFEIKSKNRNVAVRASQLFLPVGIWVQNQAATETTSNTEEQVQ